MTRGQEIMVGGVVALVIAGVCGGRDGVPQRPAPARTTDSPAFYVENCEVARTLGIAPIHEGRPGYRRELDVNHNGIACEDAVKDE